MFYYIEISQHNLSRNGLIAIGDTRHAAHDTQHVVVNRIDTDLGSVGSRNRGGREHKLEHSVVNAGEVARPARLVLFRPEREGVHVNTGVGGTSVMLERLDNIEVGSLTLGETILSVELELGSDDGVLSPAVHVKGGLGEHEGAGIRETGRDAGSASLKSKARTAGARRLGPHSSTGRSREINTSSLLEETSRVDEGSSGSTDGIRAAESMDGIGKSIDGVSVVEGLSSEGLVEGVSGNQRRAVVNVGVRLNDPNKLLARVVEVELDLVGGGPNGLVSSELELLEEVLVGVLRHLPALISVEEDVVNVEGGRNKGLLVGSGNRYGRGAGRGNAVNRPEALTDGAKIEVDLDLVVLEGNEGEGKSRVPAEPELEGHVESRLRESVTGGTNLVGGTRGGARPGNTGEGGVRDVGELRGVSNHLEVSTLLLGGEGDLVPDVHPVSVLAIDALTSDLNLNLGDELLTDKVHPAGINGSGSTGSHRLVDLGEGDLEVGAVSKISVTGDRARHAASEVSLSGEGLLDGLHREVGVAPVRHLPEGDLGGTSEENVLRAVSYKLHKCSAHVFIIVYVKIIIWKTNNLIVIIS